MARLLNTKKLRNMFNGIHQILGVIFSIGVWTTFILFISLIVSRSWFILIFILFNISIFAFVGIAVIKNVKFLTSLGSTVISAICWQRNVLKWF